MTKCRVLTQTMILGIANTDIDKPLERVYQLFKSVVSNLQTRLQSKKDEQKEETFVLLRKQYTTFFEAHKVLQGQLEEYVTREEVLQSWYTYYGQVFQQNLQTHEHIQNLEKQKVLDDTMTSKIKDQIIL